MSPLLAFDGPPEDQVDSIVQMLGSGRCPSDLAFDRHLPPPLARASPVFWTPLSVIARAAEWIRRWHLETVVDIGAGPGKFCVAAALATENVRFVGIEQRAHLVATASELAQTFGVAGRVSFEHRDIAAGPLPRADLYYLFNPFGENLFGPEERLDDDAEISTAKYLRDTEEIFRVLRDADEGMHVLTYNGFGGRFPRGWEEVELDVTLPSVLCLWEKTGPRTRALGHGRRARAGGLEVA